MNRHLLPLALAMFGVVRGAVAADRNDDLREAVRAGNLERVTSLLKSGADVNARYENQLTPVYFADDLKMIEVLVAHGATLNLRDSASLQTPLERAAEQFHREEKGRANWKAIVAKLRAAGAEYTIDAAIHLNDIAFVKEQLAGDASWVDKCRGAQSVPLRIAARAGRVEICRLLLEHKADPNDFEQGLGVPIMIDAVKHDAVVKLLIEYKANLRRRVTWSGGGAINGIIDDEATALHYAVAGGNLESVRLLLAAGLDPNAADEEGQTPLHVAIKIADNQREAGNDGAPFVKIIEHLLNNDASLRIRDRSGRTVSALAESLNSHDEVRRLLRKRRKELER